MPYKRLLMLGSALVAVGVVVVATLVADGGSETPPPPASSQVKAPTTAAAKLTCAEAVVGAVRVGSHDAILGPLSLTGAGGRYTRGRRDAFNQQGYKVPVTLPQGMTATLSVPRSLRSRVGLVFSLEAQRRVLSDGVKGADPAVRFEACPTADKGSRTGWPGGFVVDRRRCVTLVVRVAGQSPLRRRVPLGRSC